MVEKLIKKMVLLALISILFLLLAECVCLGLSIYFFILGNVTFAILCLFPFCISLYFQIMIFANTTQYFPANNFDDYKMKLSAKEDRFLQYGVKEENTLTIFIEENNGIWKTKFADKTLIFDLKHYFFPKEYIKSYFIRQLQFLEINKRKLPPTAFLQNLKLSIIPKYSNVKIEFIQEHKNKTRYIVKNGKTRHNFINRIINGSIRVHFFILPPYRNGSYVFMSEEKTFREKTNMRLKELN